VPLGAGAGEGTLTHEKNQTQTETRSSARPAPIVLVVDDEPDVRDLYTFYLRFTGMTADAATDGLDALAKASDLLPDVIVMDVMMPGVTGIEATRRLKSDARTAGIRIIALTASHAPDVRRDALDAGCDEFLTKPCPPEVLAEAIHRVLGDRP
jgi:two-component system, cell cycle response regulator DivK